MQVTEGLFSRMVLQRVRGDVSCAALAGTCQATGVLEARVRARGKTLAGWNYRKIGKAQRGKFAGQIKGLKVGGPYDIDLRISGKEAAEECLVKDVLVGDVWILAGQSNMEGIGWLKDKARPMGQVRAFYMTDTWDVAVDPLHTLWCAVDPVHGGNPKASPVQPGRHAGVGPGVAFGQELYKRTGVPQGLLACAHGGTSMSQWDPALKKEGGRSLYGAMYRRFVKNGSRVAGVFWYQGCSDADSEAAPCYTQRMKNLVQSMRRDLKDPRLPMVAVQISRVVQAGNGGRWWNSIREQQRCLPEKIKGLAVVPAIDLPMDDVIHISGAAQQVLGKRCAEAMIALRGGRKAAVPPIELGEVVVRRNAINNGSDIIVRFKNVVGSLQSAGRPTGFYLDSETLPNGCYRIDLEKDKAILHLPVPTDMVDGHLYYGYGLDPYCNILDGGGRSLPAFGPVAMRTGELRATTWFGTCPRVSAVLPGQDVKNLAYPSSVKLTRREFEGPFCDRHVELGKAGEALVYYAFAFRCSTRMKLNLLLGYDGPVKVWLDGKAIFCDPKGTNPARPEDAKVPFVGKAGKHEMMVALGSHGSAWGVFFRLERTDVSKALLRKDREAVEMPEILR